jgi:hypothetical protein
MFVDRLLKIMFGLNEETVTGRWNKNCIMRSFHISTRYHIVTVIDL